MKRKILAITFAVISVFTLQSASQTAAFSADPVNPHASPEARALLEYLYSISGRYTLAGQHNYPNHISRWTDRVYDLTGKYPALFGQDFGFSGGEDKDSTEARPAMIEEAERQYRNGAIVTLTWHAVRPTDDEPVTFHDSVQGHLTDFEWKELLTPGTDLYNRWCAQVDVIAGYLKQLRDAHVPVLFRPYHEMNGGWFWWGGRPGKDGSAALYRQLFDRFVNYHKLDNIIWVWNVNAPNPRMAPIPEYFPGMQYVDLLTEDIYGPFEQNYYNDMLTLAAGKPIALGEVGAVPAPEVLEQQPKWVYFMDWSELSEFLNPLEKLKAVYDDPRVLTRGNPVIADAMAGIQKKRLSQQAEPVTPHATAEVKSLLGRLNAVVGTSILSGQENGPQAVGASTNAVFASISKYPAIYGQDLGIATNPGTDVTALRKAIVEEAKRQHQNHAIVSFTWLAPLPTDDEAAVQGGSAQQLTDFEWKELLTPGTHLYQKWCEQVDAAARSLKDLQDAHVPVLWSPYPEANGKKFWWSGRKGPHGSAALYRQLFDRLVQNDGVNNLLWVWNAALPGANGNGAYTDFFPGLLYVDALSMDVDDVESHFRGDTFLSLIGVGKVIGVDVAGKIPDPGVFTQQSRWAWFLVAPEGTPAPGQAESLRKLYNDPRVLSRQ